MQNIINNAPIAKKLEKLFEKNIYSFHALPIANRIKSDVIGDYTHLFPSLECSITGEMFDNFFFSKGVIAESQRLTADLYGADYSFYVTSGTSVANQIAIFALYEKGKKIIIDKNCHQSIHFYTRSIGAEVVYLKPDIKDDNNDITAWSYENLEKLLLSLQKTENYIDLIILTAQSYEGMIYDIPSVIKNLISAGIKTRKFLIDEAWGSLNYFNSSHKELTAMNVQELLDKYPDLEIVCTHSAHKSLFCLRQASIIHCKGRKNLAERIEIARYSIHTTSPNYSILSSLDIAQSMIRTYGEELALHTKNLANKFINLIESSIFFKELKIYHSNLYSQWHIHQDSSKVMLDVSQIGTGFEIKKRLEQEGIYINRFIDNYLLLNFHIGINELLVEMLISALAEIIKEKKNIYLKEGEIADKLDKTVKDKLTSYITSGYTVVYS
ncbi:aminotransferase class I/II-fold pyridoxal phosphate-dependent enzyme [Pelistega ratti]|uniref:aminotransferase class I/II-fold pyridoxal phosphate-dependent enzyme n=1 Tax=Pelistega ratti TaxID=2652177 RepID=UPI00135C647D|nr:aminotransferase class I/II-fold pyridoxal phosphate-dependent enzyme [Pelistega ratti]